jgi:hypothetical protein
MQIFRTAFLLDENIRFYPGIVHEDNLFSFECLLKARRVAFLNQELYLRRVRADSIMTKPIGWRNVDGYFRTTLGAIRLVADNAHDLSPEQFDAILALIQSFVNGARHTYLQSDSSERELFRESYEPHEAILFDLLIAGHFWHEQETQKALEAIRQTTSDAVRAEYETSLSYRVGRALTYLPRKLLSLGRRFFRRAS